jgi:hypothetical protein
MMITAWFCESCASIRGCSLNICPMCGDAMLPFSADEQSSVPAVAKPVEQGKAPQFAHHSRVDVGSDIPGGGAT